MIFLTNSFTGKKEPFLHDKKNVVKMYVCGITPYDYAHLGHARCYLTFDLVYRLLTFQGYRVNYSRNFTDIDDKIIARAKKELGNAGDYKIIADRYIDTFHEDMDALQCIHPSQEPKVTESIEDIITFVERLIDAGFAYECRGSVYFRVLKFASYGALSKQHIDQLISGARVVVDEDKEHPLDFAVWKRDDEVGFMSPWGQGRPGWHIECSAMIHDTLGEVIDIHGGGLDLLFPHHENERAQSESIIQKTFVRYWMHNAFVRINKEKMSKSLQNFFTLRDVFADYDPMIVRFYFLKQHYKNPIDFSFEDLQGSGKAYKKLIKLFHDISPCIGDVSSDIALEVLTALSDDLNTSAALGIIFSYSAQLEKDLQTASEVKKIIQTILGLTLEDIAEEKQDVVSEQIELLIAEREEARVHKNWKKADEIRDQLKALGYGVQDKKIG